MSSMTISLGIFIISELAATSLIHNRPCSVARADSCPDLSRSRLLFFEYFFGVCTNVFVESTCKLETKKCIRIFRLLFAKLNGLKNPSFLANLGT